MAALTALFQNNGYQALLLAGSGGLLCFACVSGLLKLITARLQRLAAQTITCWDDIAADTLSATHMLTIAYVSLYLAADSLNLSARTDRLLGQGLVIALVLQLGLWGSRALKSWLLHRSAADRQRGTGAGIANLGVVSVIAQIGLWITILLLMLENLGVNIGALVTSLGIGGVAIALAVQNILGDLFASLSIAMDKPFVTGDFIVVDTHMGTVRHIGLKTTRIDSLSGEELVFSNADLLRSRIRNYKHMAQRRATFTFDLSYDSSAEQIQQANQIVRTAIESQEGTRFDRVHFQRFTENSLAFEAAYYVLSPAYNRYMDIQQAINLAMLRQFADAGIEFAFPLPAPQAAAAPAAESHAPPPRSRQDSAGKVLLM